MKKKLYIFQSPKLRLQNGYYSFFLETTQDRTSHDLLQCNYNETT